MREIVLDTETTGLDPGNGDRIVEIGCVEIHDRMPTGREFHRYLNPGRPCHGGAAAVHGLTDAFLADKPMFAGVAADLVAFLADSPVVAHNAAFDMGFLNIELGLAGRMPIAPDRVVCTLALARRRHPGAAHSLDALCKRFAVDRTARVKHGALLDAKLLAAVYVELTGGRQIGLGLVSERALDLAAPILLPPRYGSRMPAPARISEAELARHAALLATIRDPVWLRA